MVLFLEAYLLIAGLFSVPWVRTSKSMARAMLELAELEFGQKVLDLGSGDGAIVFTAVEMGGQGIGLERLSLLVWYARFKAFFKRTQTQALFFRADIFRDPLPPADIITSYLFASVNAQIEPRLKETYPVGTLVVSRVFPFPTLLLIKQFVHKGSTLYLYKL